MLFARAEKTVNDFFSSGDSPRRANRSFICEKRQNMKSIQPFNYLLGAAIAAASSLACSDNSGVVPIIVEAEQDGMLESAIGNFVITQSATPDEIPGTNGQTEQRPLVYIYPNNDYNDVPGTCSPSCPGTDGRKMTYTATFPRAGTYDLYMRYATVDSNEGKSSGPGNDDSFFFGYGDLNPAATDDWIKCQFVHEAGYRDAGSIVLSDGDNPGTKDVFYWMNLTTSEKTGGECQGQVGPFVIENDGDSITFSYGAREDGLGIDKFTFGWTGDLFTVADLNAGTKATGRFMDPITPIAHGKDKFLGGMYSSSQKTNFTYYFNQVVSENGGKWGTVEGTRDTMNWGTSDDSLAGAVAVAEEGIAGQEKDIDGDGVDDITFPVPFRMHVLLWGNQQPAWIEDLAPAEQLTEIQQWFTAVADQYGAQIDVLEVVNEPVNDPPKCKTPEENGGNVDTGCGNYQDALAGAWDGSNTDYAWLKTAFRMARDTFPSNVKLMLNEYLILGSDYHRQEYKKMIQALKDEGLIDVIGIQGHAFGTRGTAEELKAALDDIATLGLPIQITEMDIDGAVKTGCADYDDTIEDDPATEVDERVCLVDQYETDDALQLASYKRVFKTLWEHPAVEGVTLWGYRLGLWREEQQANIITKIGEDRPASVWLRNYVKGENVVPVVADAHLSVAEGTVMGIEVGQLSATDSDADSYISGWLIVGGTGEGLFEIDMDADTQEGRIFVSRAVTDGLPASADGYTLDVVAMDNTYMDSLPKTITIDVTTPDPDAPPVWNAVEEIEDSEKGEGGGGAVNLLLLLGLSLMGFMSSRRRQV